MLSAPTGRCDAIVRGQRLQKFALRTSTAGSINHSSAKAKYRRAVAGLPAAEKGGTSYPRYGTVAETLDILAIKRYDSIRIFCP